MTAHLEAVVRAIGDRAVAGVASRTTIATTRPPPACSPTRSAHPWSVMGTRCSRSTCPDREGATVTAGSVTLTPWHTPGHASDHLCFHVPAIGWLFTGDHLMQGSTVVIRPPDGDLGAYLTAVARVRDAPRSAGSHLATAECSRAVARRDEVLEHRAARPSVVVDALRTHGPGTAAALGRSPTRRGRGARRRWRSPRAGRTCAPSSTTAARRRRPHGTIPTRCSPPPEAHDLRTVPGPPAPSRRGAWPCSPGRPAVARGPR